MPYTAYTAVKVPGSQRQIGTAWMISYDFTPAGVYANAYGIGPLSLLDDLGFAEIFNVVLTDNSAAGPSGYVFQYDYVHNSIRFYEPSATGTAAFTGTVGTPTATSTAPTITTVTGTPSAAAIGTNVTGTGPLVQGTGGTGITGVQAPTITVAAFTPHGTVAFTGTAGVLAEVANGTAVSSVTVRATFIGTP